MEFPKRTQRQGTVQDYEFALQWLRYALANKLHVISVVETETKFPNVSFAAGESPFTELLVRIPKFPLTGPVTTKERLARFLNSWSLQKEFPAMVRGTNRVNHTRYRRSQKKFRKNFARLAVGRLGKLPPRIILKGEYEQLVGQLKLLHLEFPKLSCPLEREEMSLIIAFARGSSAPWLRLVDEQTIGLDQIVSSSPQAAAKLILAETYGCSEESIHSRLFKGM